MSALSGVDIALWDLKGEWVSVTAVFQITHRPKQKGSISLCGSCSEAESATKFKFTPGSVGTRPKM